MKHSHFTGLSPANDNPADPRQGSLFPVLIGVDMGTGKDVTIISSIEDGVIVVHEVVENGSEPRTEIGRRLFEGGAA